MELKEIIYTRRSVRKYQSTPIPHEVLEELMEGAMMAPSGVNTQPWYFVVLESSAAVEEYRDLMHRTAGNFRKTLEKRFPNNPDVVDSTIEYMSTMGGAPVIVLAFYNKPEFGEQVKSNPHLQSMAAAIENLLLMAWDKGIASCWMTAPIAMGVDQSLEETYAPDRGEFVAAVALGYPDQEPKMPARRAGRVAFL